MIRKIFSVISIFILIVSVSIDLVELIKNGWLASIKDHPHHVMVEVNTIILVSITWKHKCGGSIINPRWILTAVDCIGPDNRIVPGLKSRPYIWDNVIFYVIQVNKSPWNKDKDSLHLHNIALMKLDNKLTYNEEINEIPFFDDEDTSIEDLVDKYPSEDLWVVGFGNVDENDWFHSRELKAATIYPDWKRIDKCYSGSNKSIEFCGVAAPSSVTAYGSPCFGDEGGSLSIEIDGQNTLVGIISKDVTRKCERYVYTRVNFYAKWIDSLIKKTD